EDTICTASREYQNLKIKQIEEKGGAPEDVAAEIAAVTEKDCLCEGLGASAILAKNEQPAHKLKAVAICPGPNLAFFSGIFSLREMVDHIYDRRNILNQVPRPHMFVNELHLYLKYLKDEISKSRRNMSRKQEQYFQNFRDNLFSGISYYELLNSLINQNENLIREMKKQLLTAKRSLQSLFEEKAESTVAE